MSLPDLESVQLESLDLERAEAMLEKAKRVVQLTELDKRVTVLKQAEDLEKKVNALRRELSTATQQLETVKKGTPVALQCRNATAAAAAPAAVAAPAAGADKGLLRKKKAAAGDQNPKQPKKKKSKNTPDTSEDSASETSDEEPTYRRLKPADDEEQDESNTDSKKKQCTKKASIPEDVIQYWPENVPVALRPIKDKLKMNKQLHSNFAGKYFTHLNPNKKTKLALKDIAKKFEKYGMTENNLQAVLKHIKECPVYRLRIPAAQPAGKQ